MLSMYSRILKVKHFQQSSGCKILRVTQTFKLALSLSLSESVEVSILMPWYGQSKWYLCLA